MLFFVYVHNAGDKPFIVPRFNPQGVDSKNSRGEGGLFQAQDPLHMLYTRVVEEGKRGAINKIVPEIVPGASHIEILTERNSPVVHVVFGDYSIPATLVGDGIHMVLRLALELAACRGGLVLLEEPEVHQHPGAIRQSARVITTAVRDGVQVVLTTHSLELIDALLAASTEDDLQRMAIYRVQLDNGVLKTTRRAGPDAAFARAEIEDDLR